MHVYANDKTRFLTPMVFRLLMNIAKYIFRKFTKSKFVKDFYFN